MASKPGYNDYIFINCPFDDNYTPLLQAIIFTVYRCGFMPVNALIEEDSSSNRLDKIVNWIKNCRYAIHDISRTELNESSGLPRFNMPFELGIFFGAKRFGDKKQRSKVALIFERDKFSYQQYISDLNGVDIKAHNNNTTLVIRGIRNWLSAASRRKSIPGDIILAQEFNEFITRLPEIIMNAGFDVDKIPFNDFCQIVEEAVREKIKKTP
jgi:hypothetical protein